MSAQMDDYYALLGVPADASAAELRRAWRRLALRWHPDRAGKAATRIFQELSVAYGVLSDPASRAAYDRRQRSAAGGEASAARPAAAPEAQAPERARPPAAPVRRAPGVMLRRLTGPLNALEATGAARRRGDVVELYPSAAEVAQGGMVAVSMRVAVACPACASAPPAQRPSCAKCAGAGATEELFSAWLAVPPGVADGAVLEPSARLRGMVEPLSFQVRLGGP